MGFPYSGKLLYIYMYIYIYICLSIYIYIIYKHIGASYYSCLDRSAYAVAKTSSGPAGSNEIPQGQGHSVRPFGVCMV